MNRITPEALYHLLPAIHRLRDADEGGPLRALIAILAREGAVVEDNIEQLLDNLFIETCEDWAAPYIGAGIGYRAAYRIEGSPVGSRAEVANTIAYRRRKGTLAVLEALARDVTGWPAHAVEFFQTTATCQHMVQIRPRHHLAPDLRDPAALEPLGRAFDRSSRLADMRPIRPAAGRHASIGGRHNFPNIGLFLWRLVPMGRTRVPATGLDARRFLFDPLGAPRQLVNLPMPEDAITTIARPEHLPVAISRRMLHADPGLWMGPGRAFAIFVDGAAIPPEGIEAADLSDSGPGWNHVPHGPGAAPLVRVDPELGRLAFPSDQTGEVRVSFHTGFPARTGGGEYNRAPAPIRNPGQQLIQCPTSDHPGIQAALDALPAAGGIVEIIDSDIHAGPLAITAGPDAELILRAADGCCPILRPPGDIIIEGAENARITLDGVVIEGAALHLQPDGAGASPKTLVLRHLTLIPGLSLTGAGDPASPGAVSLRLTTSGVELQIERAITGPIRIHETTNALIRDSIIDAAALPARDSAQGLAIAGPGGEGDTGGALQIIATTVLGRVLARALPLVSDSILHARSPDGSAPIRVLRRQEGCMRFSFVPDGALVPRRYRCQPQLAIDQAIAAQADAQGAPVSKTDRARIAARIRRWMQPGFMAQAAAHPAYCQLRDASPAAIRSGASDEGEMGCWHLIGAPQRAANLRIRLEEYLRLGLEAGIFHET